MRKIAIKNLKGSDETLRVKFMLENMHKNKTYITKSKKIYNSLEKKKFLEKLKKKYENYRKNWRENPKKAIKKKITYKKLEINEIKPLCIDIEVASVCDLACPHCYRQFIATPDKLMDKRLAFSIIDQAIELNVPSMKFNWRGEPLLNPNLPEIISYAKERGILETIINTNATKLDYKMSKKIIESGLDMLIFSFDGGSKKSYEKMRPGRFKFNKFEEVYSNIKNFHKLKVKKKSPFPRTKIQMVLTEETFKEQKSYFKKFNHIVDDVSVKQYTERGGKINDIGMSHIRSACSNEGGIENKEILNLGKKAEFMRDPNGNLYVSKSRLACEQPFQRLLITYDGRASMCCYDWGSMYPVGYVDQLATKIKDKEFLKVKKKSENKDKGFEMMNLSIPKMYNKPTTKTQSLKNIWFGKDINYVRECHVNNNLEKISICQKCPFKETYKWKKIN